MAGYNLQGMVQNFLGAKSARENQLQNQQATDLFSQMLTGENPDAFGALAKLNPQMALQGQQYVQGQQAAAAASEKALNDERDRADLMELATTTDSALQNQILEQRIADITAAGGDPSDSMQLLNMPADQRQNWINARAADFKIEMPETPAEKWSQGTGDMQGYAFNEADGTYKLNPEIKTMLENKAGEKANTDLDIDDKRSINNDVTALSREPKKIQNAAARLEQLGKSKSPTDQLAAIFTFMKALDPSSVVREGEQQMAMRTGGLADSMLTYVERLKAGDSLPPEVFNNMVLTAQRISNQAINDTTKDVTGYLDAYGESLNDQQKTLYLGRMPSLFKIAEQDTTMSDDDLISKYGVQ